MDLGIGGAERLIINVACAMKTLGYNVVILTSHHDVNHCFEETKSLGYLSDSIHVYGDWLPRNIFGYGTAVCAIIRMLYLSYKAITLKTPKDVDLIFIDGISAPIPILRILGKPVMFYCHFPDKLLCVERGSISKQIYRFFIDFQEELTTGCADSILVNSLFTADIFKKTFPMLGSFCHPKVLYPTIEIEEENDSKNNEEVQIPEPPPDCISYTQGFDMVFVSLNRYERKKCIGLAIEALVKLSQLIQSDSKQQVEHVHTDVQGDINVDNNIGNDSDRDSASSTDFVLVENDNNYNASDTNVSDVKAVNVIDPSPSSITPINTSAMATDASMTKAKTRILLVVAGGYDHRVAENTEHLQELIALAKTMNASSSSLQTAEQVVFTHVEFRTSISNEERKALLNTATALLYTPDREHFGIVPIESMYSRCPVIAVRSGGPVETIVHGETGFLCDQTSDAFASAMLQFYENKNLKHELGARGRKHVEDNFTTASSTPKLREYLEEALQPQIQQAQPHGHPVLFSVIFLALLAALLAALGSIYIRLKHFLL